MRGWGFHAPKQEKMTVQPELQGLSGRQKLFVEAYLGDAHAVPTKAARMAGYRNPSVAGHRLIRIDKVLAAINGRLQTAAMGTDEILVRLSAIARSSVSDLIKIDRKGRWRVDAPAVKSSRIVRKLRATRYGDEIEVSDPVAALALLGKFRGMHRQEEGNLRAELLDAIREAERIYQSKYGDLHDEGPPPRPQLDGPPNGDG
jgi:hypothetical protein